jgi:hypothetical protein
VPTDLAPETVVEICNAYLGGTPSTRLAKQFGISCHAVLRLLRARGISIRNKGGKPKVYDAGWSQRFVEAYRSGATIIEVAKRFGVGQGTIWRSLRSLGEPPRPHGLRKATVRIPTDPAIRGYLAGLIDGEGNLQFKLRSKGRSIGCKLAIYNTHAGAMDWLEKHIGGKVRWDRQRTRRDGCLPCGIWELYRARDVALVLRAVLPYLVIKRDAALTALALFDEVFTDREVMPLEVSDPDLSANGSVSGTA